MPDVYDELYDRMLKELEESERNPIINELINRTLPNSSEATDFEVWKNCMVDSVNRHLPAIDEWSLMKHNE